jgi:hypothetical protein
MVRALGSGIDSRRNGVEARVNVTNLHQQLVRLDSKISVVERSGTAPDEVGASLEKRHHILRAADTTDTDDREVFA